MAGNGLIWRSGGNRNIAAGDGQLGFGSTVAHLEVTLNVFLVTGEIGFKVRRPADSNFACFERVAMRPRAQGDTASCAGITHPLGSAARWNDVTMAGLIDDTNWSHEEVAAFTA